MTEIRAKHISYINKYKWVLTHYKKKRLTESQSKIQSNPEMLKREKCVIGKYKLKES